MTDTSQDDLRLWEILVPCQWNIGKPIRTRHHREWDRQVNAIAGGVTIFKPTKGKWISPSGTLYQDRMIPVRIACTAKQMDEIVRRTLKHYHDQEAVMYYMVSEVVRIVYRADGP